MKIATNLLEPITRTAPFDQPARPSWVRWVQSAMLLLAFVAILLPVSHGTFTTTSKPTTTTKPSIERKAESAAEPSYVNEGYRYRDAEAGTFLARDLAK